MFISSRTWIESEITRPKEGLGTSNLPLCLQSTLTPAGHEHYATFGGVLHVVSRKCGNLEIQGKVFLVLPANRMPRNMVQAIRCMRSCPRLPMLRSIEGSIKADSFPHVHCYSLLNLIAQCSDKYTMTPMLDQMRLMIMTWTQPRGCTHNAIPDGVYPSGVPEDCRNALERDDNTTSYTF